MRPRWANGLSLAVLAMAALPVHAQTVIGAKSGVINWVEGDAFLGDKPYVMQPSQFGEVKETMVFRTEEGRAEILLPPGVFFRLGEKSSFKMISNRLIDTRIELLTGSAVMEIDDMAKEASVTVLCKDGTVTLSKAGLYRFDSQPAQVKVYKGSADVAVKDQTVVVGAGKMVQLDGAVAMSEKFNIADTDSLDRWSHRRAEVLANANVSAAKQAHYGGYGVSNPCSTTYGGYNTGPYVRPFGTYIPCSGTLNSPYGYRYWSPLAVYRAFYAPQPVYSPSTNAGGFGSRASYPTMGSTAGGYSGTVASAPSVSASAPAAASSGSSAASSAGSSSAGHGSAASGGHGR